MTPTRYREIEVSGSPHEMGRQIGEAARDEIRGFVDIAVERVNKLVRVSRERALTVAEQAIPLAESYSPPMMEELRGVAESSGCSIIELMLLQVRNQLKPDSEAGCTSLSIRDGSGRSTLDQTIVAQNWDADPALDPFTVVLTRRPTSKPAFMNITQAGLIAYIGFNDAGMGVCLNTLPAPSRERGVPHYFTVRAIYETRSLDGAVAALQRATRAIPANIMLATPDGPADLEVTLDQVCVLRDDESPGRVTHTNHCLHENLTRINSQFPELIESQPRKRRIEALLATSRATSVETIQAALRDHDGYPRSICRHTNDDVATGFWQTVFSVVIEPAARRMHVTRGTPCDRPYETYCMR